MKIKQFIRKKKPDKQAEINRVKRALEGSFDNELRRKQLQQIDKWYKRITSEIDKTLQS